MPAGYPRLWLTTWPHAFVSCPDTWPQACVSRQNMTGPAWIYPARNLFRVTCSYRLTTLQRVVSWIPAGSVVNGIIKNIPFWVGPLGLTWNPISRACDIRHMKQQNTCNVIMYTTLGSFTPIWYQHANSFTAYPSVSNTSVLVITPFLLINILLHSVN